MTDSARKTAIEAIYGDETKIKIVYSELTLDPRVEAAIRADGRLSTEEKDNLLTHALTPTERFRRPSKIEFRSTKVACVCEVRASAYLASSLTTAGIETEILASSSPRVLDRAYEQSFVSIGAYSNKLTCQLLSDPANDLIQIDVSDKSDAKFLCGRQRLTPRRGGDAREDYGLIIGIRPHGHEERIWVACAGLGEFGTSGAAFFLAEKVQQVAAVVRQKTGRFACLIRVRDEADDSGTLFKWAQTAKDWK
jgi:hypothetical protein